MLLHVVVVALLVLLLLLAHGRRIVTVVSTFVRLNDLAICMSRVALLCVRMLLSLHDLT